jgi:hypothetical protein
VRIERLSSRWTAGAIGVSRTTRVLAGLMSDLESTFARAGVLQRVAETYPVRKPQVSNTSFRLKYLV